MTRSSSQFQGVAAEADKEVTHAASLLTDLEAFDAIGDAALADEGGSVRDRRALATEVEDALAIASHFDEREERRHARLAIREFGAARAALIDRGADTGAERRRVFERAMNAAKNAALFQISAGSGELRAELEAIHEQQERSTGFILAALAAGLIFAAGAMRTLSRRVGQPLGRLRQGADRLAGGDLDHRVTLEGPAEAQSVARSFNRMAESVQAGHRILEVQALHDPLTGLANRNLLQARYRKALEASTPGRRPTLLFIDLDGFKLINDASGHMVGDQILTYAGERLEREVGSDATVGRVGGDEFVVLIEWDEDRDPAAGAAAIAVRLLAAVGAPYEVEGREQRLSASIGIAEADPTTSFEELLRRADLAMYAGKQRGAGGHTTFDPSQHADSIGRLGRIAALREAIAAEAFVLHYQPLVDLGDGRPVAIEALVRWPSPDGSLMAPADFIPLAEETGLIVPLGRWVLREACRQAAAWARDGAHPGAGNVGVNLSARQLFDPGLIEQVVSALADSGLPPERLTLEITETAIMSDVDLTIAKLHDLCDLGVALAVDDFGTGHSSLSYLRQFPVTHLKVAREFVEQIEASPRDLGLVRGIINLAHGLGHEVVAEGIETQAQAEILSGLGCELAQGFHYARPVPAGELRAVLAGLQSAASSRDSPAVTPAAAGARDTYGPVR